MKEKNIYEEKEFRIMNTHIKIELLTYIKELVKLNPTLKLYIGTDSQNHGRSTTYATVIVFHSGSGGHVIYTKEIIPIVRDRWTKLWMEVDKSVALANYLKENGIENIDTIDLDYNPNPKFWSNRLLDPAIGYVIASGFTPRHKPNAVYASIVADKICKPRKKTRNKNKQAA